MENEILVTFEQAQELNKLFKSMGVEFPTLWRYWWVEKTDTLFIVDSSISMKCEGHSVKNFIDNHINDIYVDAPELNDIRDWFVERGIVISADYNKSGKYICKLFFLDSMRHKMCTYVMDESSNIIKFDGYYDALSAGVSKAIELLKNDVSEKKTE